MGSWCGLQILQVGEWGGGAKGSRGLVVVRLLGV